MKYFEEKKKKRLELENAEIYIFYILVFGQPRKSCGDFFISE